MSRRFADLVVFITAAVWAGFAIWLGLQPGALLSAFGVEGSTPEMLTEVRAFYGGVELAIAVAMLVLWWRGELFAALLVGGLPLLGAALGRLLGMIVDGYATLHLGLAAIELIGAGICAAGCLAASRTRRQSAPRA